MLVYDYKNKSAYKYNKGVNIKVNVYAHKWIFLVFTLAVNCVISILYAYFKGEPIFNRFISFENLICIITIFVSYILLVIIDKRK